MYVRSHTANIVCELYVVRQLVPANNSDLNVKSVNVRVGFGAYKVYAVTWGGGGGGGGGGGLDEQGGDIVADCSQIVT